MDFTDEPYKTIDNYKLYYNNEESVIQTIDEIFSDKHYSFTAETETPIILDCGSNIGIATTFFKIQYPKAKIICFEPDPAAFFRLKQNIAINKFQDVTLVNAALTNKKGVVNFFGQVNMLNPDTRGNSVCSDWGMQRDTSNLIQVPSVCLSDYIVSEIDFLKLDVEGAEQQILEELGDKLRLIKQAIIEVHITDQMKAFNDLTGILELLKKYDFKCEFNEQNADCIWPNAVRKWVSQSNPKLYSITAKRLNCTPT